jgi:hypothetical protein
MESPVQARRVGVRRCKAGPEVSVMAVSGALAFVVAGGVGRVWPRFCPSRVGKAGIA